MLELWITAIGAIAAVWAAIIGTIQLRKQVKRPSPFFSVSRGGYAPSWDGFRGFTILVLNPYPVKFEIVEIRANRSWTSPFAKPKLASYRQLSVSDPDGNVGWPDSLPDHLTNFTSYSGLEIAATIPSGSPGTYELRLAASGLKDGSPLSIKYRWLDQRRFTVSTITI